MRLFLGDDMTQPEYLALPEPTDPSCSFRVSVKLEDGARISERNISLPSFLELILSQKCEMTFDEYPHTITRLHVNMVRRTVRVFAEPLKA